MSNTVINAADLFVPYMRRVVVGCLVAALVMIAGLFGLGFWIGTLYGR